MKEKETKKHPVPYYNLPEELQQELEETYGTNYIDYLKSLDQDEMDLWLHVTEIQTTGLA